MKRGGPNRDGVPVSAAAAAGHPLEGRALERAITAGLLVFFIVGDILAGRDLRARRRGRGRDRGAVWTAFALALVMAAFTAPSYAELVGKYPHAGGAGLYVIAPSATRS